jgi:SAM-dependent methyltransferase
MVDIDEYAVAAEFYDAVPTYQERSDVSFFVAMAEESRGPVLELGCGTGRVLIPTARAGVSVIGLDVSQAMLAVCQQRLSEEPEHVRARARLVTGDMRSFDLGQQVALVTIPFRPFQHLISVEDQVACLQNIRRHLQPGGRLVLDLFNPSIPLLADDTRLTGWGSEPEFTMPDGRRVVRSFRIAERDYLNQINHLEMIYHVTHTDGKLEDAIHSFPMRYLFRFEAEHLLVRCGFDVEALYSDHHRSPYGSTYPGDLIFVARRHA